MPLLKRTAGKPLSAAELRQRRDAARARWATAGATATGAYLGAMVGSTREGVRSAAHAMAISRGLTANLQHDIARARDRVITRQSARREAGAAIYDAELAGAPPAPPRRKTMTETLATARVRTPAMARNTVNAENAVRIAAGHPPMTQAEATARFEQLMQRVTPVPAAPEGAPRLARPIIGNEKNHLLYTREIWKAGKRLKLAQHHLNWVIGQQEKLGDDPETAKASQAARKARVDIASIQREIADLETLRDKAAEPVVRAETTRTSKKSGRLFPVNVTVVRQNRGGEPIKRFARRLSAEQRATRTKKANFLAAIDRQTERYVRSAERRTIDQVQEAVRQAYLSGNYHTRQWRAAGRGALLGGLAGLTATGLATLAYHVATAGRGKPANIQKIEDIDFFEPLAKFANPTDQAAIRLAQTYRRWIDRLLGRSEQPLNLADGFIEALGPTITEAFTQGMIHPPIALPDDPRYRIEVDFDLINPAQRRHIAEYVLDRIVQITDAQREQIRQAIHDQTVLRGIGHIEVARTIKEAIGLTAYQRGVVAGFRTQVTDLDPRAMARELRDKRYDRTLARAIETNTSLDQEQIDAMVDAYHRKMLALRSQTIARTEGQRATSYGGLARVQDVMDRFPELDVTKRWLATNDHRTRDTHRDLNGKEVDGMTGNFITSAGHTLRWPLDDTAPAEEVINCRCTLQYIFKPKRGQLMAAAA